MHSFTGKSIYSTGSTTSQSQNYIGQLNPQVTIIRINILKLPNSSSLSFLYDIPRRQPFLDWCKMTFFSDFRSKVNTVLSIEQECIIWLDLRSGKIAVTS